MRCHRDTTWFWNTGQVKRNLVGLFFLLLCINEVWTRPDFLDSMSRQFFGFSSDNNEQSHPQHQQQYQATPDPFAEMFGSSNQQISQRPVPRNYQNPNQHRPNQRPQRQGYYPPPHLEQQVQLPYNGPPPVYGQQQGFGQRRPDSNETKTDGFPSDTPSHGHPHHPRHPYPPVEYHAQHHQHPEAVIVEHHKPPATVIEYQTPHDSHHHPPQQVEYHHIQHQPAIVQDQHGPTLEIHTGTDHAYHEPPTHVEYHHPPEAEYHHYTTHKPKRFHLSFGQPSPDYKIIDRHLKLPPVKFRFHINPKIVITSNTKDPLEKKHHDDEHDLEPYPPPDAFSDPDAPPQINKYTVEHFPVKHHYPVEHHAVQHYAVEHPEAKHHYPVEHHAVAHHPGQEFTYDLSHGHSHLNPHRSLGHYEPTFKVKTKPIIFTEPPPTPRPPSTTRATTTTRRTPTARTTTTTTARPTRRARISARNPGFSVAFTQASTTATEETTTPSSSTTRRSTFRSNSERELENGGISARKDELSTSSEVPQSTRSTTTTTTPKSTSSTSTSTTTTTTPKPTMMTTTTTTPKPTTTTLQSTTASSTTTSTSTTPRPTTTTLRTTTAQSTTSSTTSTQRSTTTASAAPTVRSRQATPAEETTVRTTTFNVDANEIDMRKTTENPRRRPEPLLEKSPSIDRSIDRSGSLNTESSESVKVIETTMLIDGKNQTVRFYYITQPVKLPLDVFQKMTGQSKNNPSGLNVIKIRDKRYAVFNRDLGVLPNL